MRARSRLAPTSIRRPATTATLLALQFLLLMLAGPAAATSESKAFVITSDFSTGSMSAVDLDTRAVAKDVAGVWRDATLRWFNGKLYVVNRLGQDNIQVVDPAAGYATVLQFSTDPGSNPQDIAFATPTKAFVSLYGRQALLVCNPQTGATLDTISLASFADADHLPEMAHLALVNGRLFVAVQRLDRLNGYKPTDYSLVVAIDVLADTVLDADPITPGKQGIMLTGKNPVTTFSYVPETHRLLIGCAGAFQQFDGGVESIDVDGLRSDGLIALESQLGGDIGDIEWYSPTHSYAIVSDVGFNSSLIAFNPSNGAKLGTLRAPGGFSLPDCAINDRGEIYVADNGFLTAGLYVYRAGADTLIAGPLDTGLPPNQITFDAVRAEVAGVGGSGGPGVMARAIELAAPWPNPARKGVTLALRLRESGTLRVEVFDLAGRRVATLADGPRKAGEVALQWNGSGPGGRPAEPGIYLARARVGNVTEARRFVLIK
jgi:hypothetical protein